LTDKQLHLHTHTHKQTQTQTNKQSTNTHTHKKKQANKQTAHTHIHKQTNKQHTHTHTHSPTDRENHLEKGAMLYTRTFKVLPLSSFLSLSEAVHQNVWSILLKEERNFRPCVKTVKHFYRSKLECQCKSLTP
jgi:hypothetical protein